MARTTSLVIGGTGVTGVELVAGLLERKHVVSVLHSGRHKPSKDLAPWYYDGSVQIIIANPFKEGTLREGFKQDFYYDHVFSNYGNLLTIAKVFAGGHCGRFYSVGGMPIYNTYGDAAAGPKVIHGDMISPLEESGPISTVDGTLASKPNSHNPKVNQMVLAEQAVFHHHPTATHVRYPLMYGPYQLMPREWIVVKRILDKRKFIILPNGGETMHTRCSSRNGAKLLLSCLDCPEGSSGEVFNAADEEYLTTRQWVEVIAQALDYQIEIVSLPAELAIPARPLTAERSSVASLKKVYQKLNYTAAEGAVEALTRTARWLAKNPPSKFTETLLQDPFDYVNEDKIRDYWREGNIDGIRNLKWEIEPGLGHFTYGKEVNPYDKKTVQERHVGQYDPLKVRRVKESKL